MRESETESKRGMRKIEKVRELGGERDARVREGLRERDHGRENARERVKVREREKCRAE